tara:strand:+ start:304 stop:600 length:297 start_codon:yes stop_codon:yes gene_type:complete
MFTKKLFLLDKNNIDNYKYNSIYFKLNKISPIKYNTNNLYFNQLIFKNYYLNKNIKNKIYNSLFKLSLIDYYQMDLISLKSKLMKQCSNQFTKTHNYV